MSNGNLDQAIEALREFGSNEPLVAQLQIFGSRAEGRYRADSDLDVSILLTCPPHERHLYWRMHEVAWQRELSRATRFEVHLVPVHEDLHPDDFDLERFNAAPKVLAYIADG